MAEEAQEKEPEAAEQKTEEKPAEEEKVKKEKPVYFKESKLKKDGALFFKRKTGKPRYRKIESKKGEAQLYFLDQGNWQGKSAVPEKGAVRNAKWHLKNNWVEIKEKDVVKNPPKPKKPKAEKEEEKAEAAG